MRRNSVFASTMLQHYSSPISINDWDNTDCSELLHLWQILSCNMQHKFIDIGCHSGLYMTVSVSASLSVYTAYNDSHRNVRKYQTDSHFAMRIILFSSLLNGLQIAKVSS